MCDPSMHATAAGRWRLETDLRRAIVEEEFRVHYQPIVSLSDSRIVGFEALVRWQRPKVGLVMPAGFISVAEDTGLILRIGKLVLAEACRQMRAWNLQLSSAPPFTMAVNISACQFADTDLVNQIDNILSDSGLAPRYLRLELTESVTMCNEERTAQILSELRSKGVRVSIDDFGIGYSSLSYLRRFGPDVLKIDRSFISEMVANNESQEIVKAVLGLGNNLGMDVVAEGVETAEQSNMLTSLGCKYGQGYFFSKPLDSAAATRCLVKAEAHNYKLSQGSMTQLLSLREVSAV
jgi:EAL domain-containing protein (putative c-di-GMP-specific phosphodiesterase class I)